VLRSREVASNWCSFVAAVLLVEDGIAAADVARVTAHRLREEIGVAPWSLLRPYVDAVEADIIAASGGDAPDPPPDPWVWMDELTAARVEAYEAEVS
jgi:hypothetical protein